MAVYVNDVRCGPIVNPTDQWRTPFVGPLRWTAVLGNCVSVRIEAKQPPAVSAADLEEDRRKRQQFDEQLAEDDFDPSDDEMSLYTLQR